MTEGGGPPGLLQQAWDLHRQGRLEEARLKYRETIAADPRNADALHYLGVLEAQRGDFTTAIGLIERAVAAAPGNAAAHYNLANALRELGRFEEALNRYESALDIKPGDTGSLINRGAVLHELGRFGDALVSYDRALMAQPDHAGAHSNRGNTLLALKQYDAALASYERALALRPQSPDAWFGRGKALLHLSRHVEALASFSRAAGLDPDHAEAHANRGHALFQLHRFQEALAAYDRAIALAPGLAPAHRGRGDALFKLGRGAEAFAAYDNAYLADPDLDYIEGTRFLTKLYVCDWSNFDAERQHLVTRVMEGKPAANPFAFLMAAETAAQQLVCARAYAAAQYPASTMPLWTGEKYQHRKIRIGYVSGEFREQATAFLVADLFECHDRDTFELHAISTGMDDKSAMRKRIVEAFDVFSNVAGRSDRDIAEMVRRDEIDILVNLNGFFGEERTGLAAFRPCPIQVSYLGYPGTMGAPYIDYLIADRWIIPESRRHDYSENIVYLPDTYQANDRKKAIAEGPRRRAEFGLPETGFVFCSFNNAYKITPDVFSIWMRLLHGVPGSVLWLLQVDAAVERNLKREAEARGVTPERLVFAPFIPLKDHLARGRLADLFLDTLPVNAHTTASDALWMGVPVLTCLGDIFAGRVAASLLSAIGLSEMITGSLADYEALALKLARDASLLDGIRAKLARNRDTHPLFDTPRLTRHLEAAYRTMWDRHQNGLVPQDFAVEAIPSR